MQVRDLVVVPVNGAEVLQQVVGADTEKVECLAEVIELEGHGRHLDHRAELHQWGKDVAVERAPCLFLGHHPAHVLGLLQARDHGHHHAQVPERRGAHEGAHLRSHQRLELMVHPHGAEAEVGVLLVRHAQVGNGLVAADIERADDHRSAGRGNERAAVFLELLLFARRVITVQEEHLGPEQADAVGPFRDCRDGLVARCDVGADLHRLAIPCLGAGGSRVSQLVPASREPRLLHLVVAVCPRVSRRDQHAKVGVDDDIPLAQHCRAQSGDAGERWDAERPGQDDGMRGGGRKLEHETLQEPAVQREEFPGRQVLGNAHRVRRQPCARRHLGRSVDDFEQLAADVSDIEGALAKQSALGGRQHSAEERIRCGNGAGHREAVLRHRHLEVVVQCRIARDGVMRANDRRRDIRSVLSEFFFVLLVERAEPGLESRQFGVGIIGARARQHVRNRKTIDDQGAAVANARHHRCAVEDAAIGLQQHARQGSFTWTHGCRRYRIVTVRQVVFEKACYSSRRLAFIDPLDGDATRVALPDVEADDAQYALGIRRCARALADERDLGDKAAYDMLKCGGWPGVESVGQRAGEGAVKCHELQPREERRWILQHRMHGDLDLADAVKALGLFERNIGRQNGHVGRIDLRLAELVLYAHGALRLDLYGMTECSCRLFELLSCHVRVGDTRRACRHSDNLHDSTPDAGASVADLRVLMTSAVTMEPATMAATYIHLWSITGRTIGPPCGA